MKRIIIGAVGTKGDARPAIALGKMLAETCEIALVAPPENREAAERAGLGFLPLGKDFSEVVKRGDLREYREQIGLQFTEYRDEYKKADSIIGFSLFFAGASLAEWAGRPYDHAYFTPQVFPSRLLGPPSSKRVHASRLSNAIAWKSREAQDDFILKTVINEGRESLGLKAIGHVAEARPRRSAVLAVDEAIALPPADVADVRQAHYWSLDESLGLDGAAKSFIEEGEPPILLCLGSVSGAVRDSWALLRKAAAALRDEGARVILVHPEAAEAPTAVDGGRLEARSLPFEALLPRCSAIVHQGGIGTLFAAARAGTPQLVLPCMLDQFYWAERVRELGIGRSEKGPGALAEGLFAKRLLDLAGDKALRDRAEAFSALLRSSARDAQLRLRIGELFLGK